MADTNLKDFHELVVDLETSVADVMEEYAERTRQDVKNFSPYQAKNVRGHMHYALTWEKTWQGKLHVVIHNKENYRLTHLLENGHFIVNKKVV